MKEPFDYQRFALDRLEQHFKENNRALLVMASGLGKSFVAANWVKPRLSRGRALVLCHDTNILAQLMQEFREEMDNGFTFGSFNGEIKETEKVDVLFATFQTFREWMKTFFPSEFATVIIDESHHSEANTYRPVVEYFKPEKFLAMTATPDRADGRDIRKLFGEEVVNICLEEAIASGWLTPIEYHLVIDDLNAKVLKEILHEVGVSRRRVSMREVNETIFIRKRDEEIARQIQDFGKKTIVFCEGTEHAQNFSQYLPGAKTFHSGNPFQHNQEVLADFRVGKLQYILAVNKFNEGIDVPDAEMIVFLRRTESPTVFLQQLGRGLRKQKGKDKVIVLDFVGNCDRVLDVQQMMEKIATIVSPGKGKTNKQLFYAEGKSFKFVFTDEYRDIIDVIRRVQQKLYISDIPHLLAEYDRERNPLPPEQVIAGTNKKVHWVCSKCGHNWFTTGSNRIRRGHDCPACVNRAVTAKNCLAVTHPELAKEFHPTENALLTPYDIVAGSHTKVWWQCLKPECQHKWQASVASRTHGRGCPACVNRAVTAKNCLAVTHPELAKEFHPTKNASLTPYNIVAGSGKKIWWQCLKPECWHEWQASINNRVVGSGCPACANREVTAKNCLAVTHPELAKEFHPTKNASLTPYDIVAGSEKKIWWLSLCGHAWHTEIRKRTSGCGCPKCCQKKRWETRRRNMALKKKN
jgi:superfamily II DNA or RNA helicase